MSTCCIILTPFSLTVIAMVQAAVVSGRSNNVNLSKRIIDLAPDFVHTIIRIGPLDFQKGTQ